MVEKATSENLGELRRGKVAGRVRVGDGILADYEGRTVPEDGGQQVEEADDPGRSDDRRAGGLGVRHGEEPDQDMGQARRPEHEGYVERDHVEAQPQPFDSRGGRRRYEGLPADLALDRREKRERVEPVAG